MPPPVPYTCGAMSASTASEPTRPSAETMSGRRLERRASKGASTAPVSGSATVSGSSEPAAAVVVITASPSQLPDLVGVQGAVVLRDPYHDGEEYGGHRDADDDRGQAEVLQYRIGDVAAHQVVRRAAARRADQHRSGRSGPVGHGDEQQVGGALHQRESHHDLDQVAAGEHRVEPGAEHEPGYQVVGYDH